MLTSSRLAHTPCGPAAGSPPVPAVGLASSRSGAKQPEAQTHERKGGRAVSAKFAMAHARRGREAGAPEAGWLGRVKGILAATTRQDREADGPRLWAPKGG